MAKKTEFSVKIEGDVCTIVMPANTKNPPESSSGKSHLVATTHGFVVMPDVIKGETVKVLINVLKMK
jgi:hypothetical protein